MTITYFPKSLDDDNKRKYNIDSPYNPFLTRRGETAVQEDIIRTDKEL
jgi:hypothetical protein